MEFMDERDRYEFGVVPRDLDPEILGQMALLGEFPEAGVFEQLTMEDI